MALKKRFFLGFLSILIVLFSFEGVAFASDWIGDDFVSHEGDESIFDIPI